MRQVILYEILNNEETATRLGEYKNINRLEIRVKKSLNKGEFLTNWELFTVCFFLSSDIILL